MRKIVDIIEALVLLYAAWWGFSYYTGRVNYTGKQEERRQKKVEQYRWILLICIVVMLITGLWLLILTITWDAKMKIAPWHWAKQVKAVTGLFLTAFLFWRWLVGVFGLCPSDNQAIFCKNLQEPWSGLVAGAALLLADYVNIDYQIAAAGRLCDFT